VSVGGDWGDVPHNAVLIGPNKRLSCGIEGCQDTAVWSVDGVYYCDNHVDLPAHRPPPPAACSPPHRQLSEDRTVKALPERTPQEQKAYEFGRYLRRRGLTTRLADVEVARRFGIVDNLLDAGTDGWNDEDTAMDTDS
jgi:hypothetical protein